jgi:predicted  nucleic acid-binding Zn-ribbon protein
MDNDIQGLQAAIQQVLQYASETQAAVLAMRGELTQVVNDIQATSQRIDQKDTNLVSITDNLRNQVDVLKGQLSTMQSALESRISSAESAAKDAKDAAQQARNMAAR